MKYYQNNTVMTITTFTHKIPLRGDKHKKTKVTVVVFTHDNLAQAVQ